MKIMWAVTIAGAAWGVSYLSMALSGATGAPQQAAGAAIGCALAILPYIITRSVEGIVLANDRAAANRATVVANEVT